MSDYYSQMTYAQIFDNVVESAISEENLARKYKVRFVSRCFVEVTSFGWKDYALSNFWISDIVQDAYKVFTGELDIEDIE